MRRRKRRKRKTRIGSKLAALILALGVCGLLPAGQKPRKGQEAYAIVSGTVFRESGFALPGAEVTLSADPDPPQRSKIKKIKAASDARGEFAFRVPAVPMKYRIQAEARGYKTGTREVAVQGEERVEVSFQLSPTSNQ